MGVDAPHTLLVARELAIVECVALKNTWVEGPIDRIRVIDKRGNPTCDINSVE